MAAFLTEPEPPHDAATIVAPGIRRLVAANPGAMTYHGTNTYLIDRPDGLVVLDPGPENPAHTQAVLAACAGPVALILLSHSHLDHLDGLPALRTATGAPVAAWHAPETAFAIDTPLHDGDAVCGLLALHTPGHAPDHLCFAAPGGVLFSADHVMGWSSSIVVDMAGYMRSLDRVLARDDAVYLPGHGPPIPQPRPFVAGLRDHRLAREAAVIDALRGGSETIAAIAARLYQVGPDLVRAAERNVLAHLHKLEGEGRVNRSGAGWRLTPGTSSGC